MTNDEAIKIAGKINEKGGKAEEATNVLIETSKNKWAEHIKIHKKEKILRKNLLIKAKKINWVI